MMPASLTRSADGATTAGARFRRRRNNSASRVHVWMSASTRRPASAASQPSARADSYAISACAFSSSMMSSPGSCPPAAKDARRSDFHSGMTDPCHAVEGQEERFPDGPLLEEHLATGGGEPVIAAAPLAGAFYPAAFDQPLVFEAIERGVQRRGVKSDRAARPFVDQAADVVTVALALVEQCQDEHLRAAPLQLTLERRRAQIWRDYISDCAWSVRTNLG